MQSDPSPFVKNILFFYSDLERILIHMAFSISERKNMMRALEIGGRQLFHGRCRLQSRCRGVAGAQDTNPSLTTMTASITTKDDRELHKIYKLFFIVSQVLRINSIDFLSTTAENCPRLKRTIVICKRNQSIHLCTVTFTWFQLWEQTLRWQNNWHADWTIAVKRDWTWSMRRAWGWPGASTRMVATTTWCIPPFLTDDLQREPGQQSRSWSTHWFCWESSFCRKINRITGGSGWWGGPIKVVHFAPKYFGE